ncbi:hypothetical protein A2U01_0110626, partial [Trifolium medium]|nr:hypothetical protein [Trifolium medium]
MVSSSRKNDGNHRSGATEKWKGVRSFNSEEMEERRLK